MSYLGYTKLVSNYCNILHNYGRKPVTILEIGVDRGQTSLPLLHNLISNNVDFVFIGVDIRLDDCYFNQLVQMDGVNLGSNYHYVIKNSLDWFPEFTAANPDFKFDVILLDGDHNYQTVTRELEFFDQISFPHTLCVLDDYNGKHADKDDYYADKESHQGLDHKEFDRESSKKGMQNAINDFLASNDKWKLLDLNPQWEPVIITRDLNIETSSSGGVQFSFDQPSTSEEQE